MHSLAAIVGASFISSTHNPGSDDSPADIPAAQQTDPSDREIHWTVGEEPRELTLTWVLKEPVPAGTYLRVRSSGLHCLDQYRIDSLTAHVEEHVRELAVVRRYTREEQQQNWMFFVYNPYLVAVQPDEDLPPGTEMTAKGTFGKTAIAGTHFHFRLERASNWDERWTAVTGWNIVSTRADKADRMEAYHRTDGRVHILYLDRFCNPAQPGQRKVRVHNLEGAELLSASVDAAASVQVRGTGHQSLPERVVVKDNRGFEALSTARPRTGLKGAKTYFGEIHWHTEFSGDGHRALRESLDSARDEMGLDFASPGDHAPFTMGYRLEDYLDILDEYDESRRYVTLLGYELSLAQGHFNLYYRNRQAADKFEKAWAEFQRDPRHAKPDRLWLGPFHKHWKPEELLIVPHHTNLTSGKVITPEGYALWRNFDWRAVDDNYTRVVEIVQVRGSFECEGRDADWRVISGGYGSSIRTALARGLRFGFIGGTDNHSGWPVRSSTGPDYCGLTAVQAPELTRDAVFEALRARRAYATSGPRIVLDFTLNGEYPMGSEVALTPLTERTFNVIVRGTAPLDRVEIVHQGATLAILETDGTLNLEVDWTDARSDAPLDNSYYYLRVRQTDGHCAWSSPIWIDYSE